LTALAIGIAGCGGSGSTPATGTTARHVSPPAAVGTQAVVLPGSPRAGAKSATRAALAELPKVPLVTDTAEIVGVDGLPMAKQIHLLDVDIDAFWRNLFERSKLSWPSMTEWLVVNRPRETGCTGVRVERPTSGPGLCDDTILWGVPWAQRNLAPLGAAAVAIDASVLFSFKVQDELGLTGDYGEGKLAGATYFEQTLCLSGLYARTLQTRSLLQSGDTNRMIRQIKHLLLAGNKAPADKLVSAFNVGFRSGEPSKCDA
jgi:hypothetical protein